MIFHNKIILTFILILLGCKQSTSPIILKGETFYGNPHKLEETEYFFAKSKKNNESKIYNKKTIIHKSTDNQKKLEISKVSCDFIMPIKGIISSKLGENSVNTCNDGININVQEDKNVKSVASGKVIYIGEGLKLYGNLIIIEHNNQILSLYSNLDKVYVKAGDKVKQKQKIASFEINAKLCFAMYVNNKPIDPLHYINIECN